ncbi:helix-turn-helix transcriptional regulator [Sneathiella sp.]|jgi:predicted DNA-binding transcriptional regulator YafY|uniref:helix-turn-helix transcriptional regulator n=1 Tax=Sneathiella sp. TaxID=1964365 RepID=UPI0039E25BE0
MRRADRLFQVIQILQSTGNVITAAMIADELEVSTRTIYRDIQDLMANRVPIRGEAGTGYILDKGYDLPPLMFNEEEIDAVMLGVHWVLSNGDPDIQRAARDVLGKIRSVLPKDRQELMQSARQVVPQPPQQAPIQISMPMIRRSIRERRKLEVVYRSLSGDISQRVICPMIVVFFQNIQLLVGWCELRRDYRNFRMDCFQQAVPLDRFFSRSDFESLDSYLKRSKESQQSEKSG